MRAVVYEEFRLTPEIVSVADPACPPEGVVVAVEATGLCRSDWHGWMGHDPDIRLPHVPGHELAGTVVEVGPDVRAWSIGARVTTPFVLACGTCATCRRGDHQVCDRQFQPGFTHPGSFAELVAIDRADVNLVALPEDLDFDTAAGLGCRFGTAYRAIADLGEVGCGRPGRRTRLWWRRPVGGDDCRRAGSGGHRGRRGSAVPRPRAVPGRDGGSRRVVGRGG